MAFESLTDKLQNVFKKLRGKGRLTEEDVKIALKEVKMALLEADVNFKVVKRFVKAVEERAIGADVMNGLNPGQMVIKIVNEEMTALMGSETTEIALRPGSEITVIMMAGLQGAGKTTTTAKIAGKLKSKGRKPLLAACDVYRPAAIEQLKVLASQIDVPVYTEEGSKNPVEIARNAIKYAKTNNLDLVIVDTAGRLAVDSEMMDEIENIKNAINPQEVLFVVDAMTGQDAVNTAREFNERLDFDGVVLTKLDGDTRGGAALSIRTVVNKPIKFIGTGEKLDGIEPFHPDRMAKRILGMGDVVTLVERAQQIYDEKQAADLQRKIAKNQFNFNDFYAQIQQIKKMGNIKDLASMIPGVGKAIKDIDIDDNAFAGVEAIINSMTKAERETPEIVTSGRTSSSRRQRIAKGSGRPIQEVNRLVKQFEDMRKMMKAATAMKNPMKMMKQMRQMRQMGRR